MLCYKELIVIGILIEYPKRKKSNLNVVTYDKGDRKMCRQLIQEIRRADRSIEAMPRCAERILDYFKIPEDMQTPIVYILNEMGIVALRGPLEPKELSAYIAVNPGYKNKYGSNKIACVNIKDNLGHQRFALAHELAHYLFDYDEVNNATYYNTYFINESNDLEIIDAEDEEIMNVRDFQNNNTQVNGEIDIEYRANKFAAALLMPQKKFVKKYNEFYKKTDKLPEVIDQLSQFFEVSRTAVTRRITEVIDD